MNLHDPVEEDVSHFTIELFLGFHRVANRKVLLVILSDKLNNINHKGLIV